MPLAASARAAGIFLLGSLPLTLLLMWYQARAFGGPLESGYRHLADVAYQPWHEGGFLGVGLPHARAFLLSFFSPLRGLFVLSPALLLAVPGIWLLCRGAQPCLRPVAWATVAIVAGYTYFTSSFSYESWGWTTGPRHLTPLVPFLLLPCAFTVERARASWLRGPCGVLLASSVFFTSALTFVNYIPDDVSNAIVGLSVPLTRAGYFVPSILCALGLRNPEAGMVIWAGVGAIVVWLLWSFRPQKSLAPLIATLGTATALIAFQVLTYRNSPQDRGALALLQRVWLTPPGRPLVLFK